MKAKDFKNSILQMAVQGKLVLQDPNDEPASVLLERIREERAALIKEKRLKAPKGGESVIYRGSDGSYYEKRGNGKPVCIDKEIPFEIPKSWEWVRLDSLAAILNGDRGKSYPAKSTLKTEGIPFVSAINIQEGTISKDGLLCVDDHQYHLLRAGKLVRNDFVFCIRGSLGKYGRFQFEKGAIASSLVIVRAYLPSFQTSGYFDLLLGCPLVSVQIEAYNNGTAQPNLAAADFMRFLFPIPPKEEQNRIVEATAQLYPLIDEYSALEGEREKLDAELPDRLRKSILQMAVQGKLVPQDPNDEPASVLLERIRRERAELIKQKKLKAPKGGESVIYCGSDGGYYEKRGSSEPVCIDDEIPFEIPENWEWARLGSLCNYGQCTNIEYGDIEDGTWVLELEDIEKDAGRITVKRFKNGGSGSTKHVFHTGEILYSKLRPYLNKVVVADEDGAATSEILPLDFLGLIEPEYAQLALMSPHFLEYANVCSYGVKMPRLGTEDGEKALIPVAPYTEQSRIVVAVEKTLQELTNRQ